MPPNKKKLHQKVINALFYEYFKVWMTKLFKSNKALPFK